MIRARSVDYINEERSDVMDAPSTTAVNSTCVKLHVWYDNECGNSIRMPEPVAKADKMVQQRPHARTADFFGCACSQRVRLGPTGSLYSIMMYGCHHWCRRCGVSTQARPL
eukprot:TRINITY_DN1289_c1_g2_i1.p1 TRINITY_DN1289_c1_g2~~TRINITY_DN1289_c1_g2_i1.p1  ORF type:complete len:111 (+),score=8.39 TRINITY_DN1289_c1_g2_i1:348-680(+)